jgi:hypothetical protein
MEELTEDGPENTREQLTKERGLTRRAVCHDHVRMTRPEFLNHRWQRFGRVLKIGIKDSDILVPRPSEPLKKRVGFPAFPLFREWSDWKPSLNHPLKHLKSPICGMVVDENGLPNDAGPVERLSEPHHEWFDIPPLVECRDDD